MIDKFNTFLENSSKELMDGKEFLESNNIKDKIVHIRQKMGGDIEVSISDILNDYKDYLIEYLPVNENKNSESSEKSDEYIENIKKIIY